MLLTTPAGRNVSPRPTPKGPLFVDANRVETDLRHAVRGEVRFDPGSRALYATDGSNYRQVPIGVVIPEDTDDVIATVSVCREHGIPVLSRGGGTSLTGACCNVAVVMDFSKRMNRVLWVDPAARLARVQPGVALDHLRCAAEKHGLTFAPDPSTHQYCTLGGMIGNNSCGVHSLLGLGSGRTSDQVDELEILLYDGTRLTVGATPEDELDRIIASGGHKADVYARLKALRDRYAGEIRRRYPDLREVPRRVSGYNLDDLLPERGFHVARALSGTEGTCVTVLEAQVHLVPSPRAKSLLVLGYPDVYSAADHIEEVLDAKPVGLEGIDDVLVGDMKKKHIHPQDVTLLPPGRGWLMVEFGGERRDESDDKVRQLMDRLKRQGNAPSMSSAGSNSTPAATRTAGRPRPTPSTRTRNRSEPWPTVFRRRATAFCASDRRAPGASIIASEHFGSAPAIRPKTRSTRPEGETR